MLPDEPFRPGAALLFDIDGTMADTDRVHLVAFNRIFAPYGHGFDRATYTRELQGWTNAAIAEKFLTALPLPARETVMFEKEQLFRDMAATDLTPMPGLIALLDLADARGLPYAAVTNAPRANAEMILSAIGLRARFRHLVIAEELDAGKPHPRPYLEGLRRLGASAEASVAFEDSRTGITSATAAGIATVAVLSSLAPADVATTGAIAAVTDYTDRALPAILAARLLAR